MIKFGITGFGLAAKVFHLPLITRLPNAQVSAVYSSKPAEEVHKIVPEAQVFNDVDQFIANADMDAVVIVTPNDYHAEIATKALLANKHVILDKPFVCNTEEGQALIELAAKQQKLLTVYHNRRWDGDFLTVQKLRDEERLGEVRYFESRFDKYRPRVWGRWREQNRPGAGLVFDIGSHLIDQALTFFGKPQTISAKVLQTRDAAEANDYFDIQLSFNDHRQIARLRGSSFARVSPFRFYVEGTHGTFTKQHMDVQEAQMHQNLSPYGDEWGVDLPANYGQLMRMPPNGDSNNKELDEPVIVPTERGCYQTFYENFMLACEGKAELEVTAQQALDVIRIIELAIVSSQTGKEVNFE